MAASVTSPPTRRIGGGPTRSVAAASWTALGALMLRDLVVLRKHLWEFVLRTIIQPFLPPRNDAWPLRTAQFAL